MHISFIIVTLWFYASCNQSKHMQLLIINISLNVSSFADFLDENMIPCSFTFKTDMIFGWTGSVM